MAGRFAQIDAREHNGRKAVAKGQQQEFAVAQAQRGQQTMQQPQHRITDSETDDGDGHAGGLVNGIGRQQLVVVDQQWNGGLFSRGEKLGEDRFHKGHADEGPVAPTKTQPHRTGQQGQGRQQDQ